MTRQRSILLLVKKKYNARVCGSFATWQRWIKVETWKELCHFVVLVALLIKVVTMQGPRPGQKHWPKINNSWLNSYLWSFFPETWIYFVEIYNVLQNKILFVEKIFLMTFLALFMMTTNKSCNPALVQKSINPYLIIS